MSSDQQNSRSTWVFAQSHQGLVHFVHSIHIAPDKVLFFQMRTVDSFLISSGKHML